MDNNLSVSLFCLLLTSAASGLKFANSYSSHMVLQRAPHNAIVWGYADLEGQEVSLTMGDSTYPATAFTNSDGSVVWRVTLDAVEDEGPYVITVSSGEISVQIEDVLFGDVWFCSGQSNMAHAMYRIDNPDPDLDDAVNFPKVRSFFGSTNAADDPLYDTPNPVRSWSLPNRDTIYYFSAVCWLFGKRLYQTLNRPIGLILSSWGGTRIEAWMSPEALAECTSHDRIRTEPNTEHALWNGMVNPFLNTTITGAIWYQGESNVGNADQYRCLQQSMIEDWRKQWFIRSGSSTERFPFGVVQLAPYNEDSLLTGYSDLRWSQTGGYGYTPNPALQDVFLAVAIDLPDFNSPWGSVHPRYKRQIGQRLALGAFQVAYGNTEEGRFQGPFPTRLVQGDDSTVIIFDNGTVEMENRVTGGFEVCCSEDCTWNSAWQEVDIIEFGSLGQVTISDPCVLTSGIRYLWRESPCALEMCALYSVENELPVPPFKILNN